MTETISGTHCTYRRRLSGLDNYRDGRPAKGRHLSQ